MAPNFCRCPQCGPDGRRLGTIEFQIHQVSDNRHEALAHIPSESSAELTSLDSPTFLVDVGQPSGLHNHPTSPARYAAAWAWLAQVDAQLLQRNASILRGRLRSHSFRFSIPPRSQTHLYPLVDPTVLALDDNSQHNRLVISHDRWLEQQKLAGHSYLKDCIGDTSLSRELILMLKRLRRDSTEISSMKQLEWERQRCIASEVNQVDPGPYMDSPFSSMEPWVALWYILVLSLHLLSGVSLKICTFYFSGLKQQPNVFDVPKEVEVQCQSLPGTVETIVKRTNITPKFKSFICCPNCFSLYDHEDGVPRVCTSVEDPGGPTCGAALYKNSTNKPVREYIMHDFKDWLARLYARPGMEEYLDRDVYGSTTEMNDIWDGSVLRSFNGTDGKLFVPHGRRHVEGRLIFSLNMDSFNPFGNMQNGKHVSIGAIYMTCLNLPRELRNKMENIFLVGIIPGPNEPSLTQINHITKPLIDVLLELWMPGVYLRRTRKYPRGRRVKAAVVPLVSDLLAAKKMAAFASATSKNFCSHCHITLNEIHNLDYWTWKRRTWNEHLMNANAWKNALTSEERDRIFANYGVRWSELLRLPYWDPSSFVVIDSMHCFYLGLFNRHAVQVWGMDATKDDSDSTVHKLKAPNEGAMQAMAFFQANDLSRLASSSWNALAFVCASLGIPCDGTKEDMLLRLKNRWNDSNALGSTQIPISKVATSSNSVTPLQAMQTILEIPSIDVDNVTESNLSKEEATNLWHNATKSKLRSRKKGDLLAILLHQGVARAELETLKKNDLFDKIQALRKEQRIIDINEKKLRVGNPVKTSRLTRQSSSIIISQDHGYVKAAIPAAVERHLLAHGHVEGTVSVPPRTAPDIAGNTEKYVLGKTMIPKIREDMGRLIIPSWVPKGPAHPGEAKGGKLHADQWRSFFTINLPITLLRLWGGDYAESKKGQMLGNFFHLVTAVELASRRTVTERHVRLYEEHMHQYLVTLSRLFPKTKLVPNQHNALHFGEYLRRFGPTHGWRCFAFERFNYLLQQTSTNKIVGKIEGTMFRKFCMAQNLRSLYNSGRLPDQLRLLVDKFSTTFNHDLRGTLLNEDSNNHSSDCDLRRMKEGILSRETYQLLVSWTKIHDSQVFKELSRKVLYLNAIYRDVVYKIHRRSPPDSHIIFTLDDTDEGKPGYIECIFTHSRTTTDGKQQEDTFIVVHPYQTVSLQEPYQNVSLHMTKFSSASGFFFRKTQLPPTLIVMNQIRGHFGFALTDYDNEQHSQIFQGLPLFK